MPYVPGPFTRIDEASFAPETDSATFSDDAIAFASQLQAIASGWNGFFTGLEDLASDPLDDLEGLAIDAITGEVSVGFARLALPSLDDALSAYDASNTQLGYAVSFAPAQAWQDPPAAFVPPGDNYLPSAPILPPGGFDATANGTVGDTTATSRPRVNFYNITRVGTQHFVVGDTFAVAAFGKAGQVVSGSATLNGQDMGRTTFGTLDNNGEWGIQGVLAPTDAGAWHEDWYFDDVPVTSFNFVVVPALIS